MKAETKKEVISWVKVIVGAVLFSFFFTNFVVVHANVPTGSMMDTVPEKSRIIGNRLSYVFSDPQRYDVVAFEFPDNEDEIYLKRIIGLPGETVQVIAGKVYINGSSEPLDDSFTRELPSPSSNSGPFKVPEDCYFMMGDNRNNSHDSRKWVNKYVKKEKILGKVFFSYWPEIKTVN